MSGIEAQKTASKVASRPLTERSLTRDGFWCHALFGIFQHAWLHLDAGVLCRAVHLSVDQRHAFKSRPKYTPGA